MIVAWLGLAAMIAGTALAFLAPWPTLVGATVLGLAAMRGRKTFVAFVVVALPLNVLILGFAAPPDGWTRGFVGGMRLAAALALNLAIVTRLSAERLLEGLRLPPRATALLAAVLLAAHDLARDFERLKLARRLDASWPNGRLARAREGARLLPALVVAAHKRALTRREALQLAGHPSPEWFVPLVAIAALCAAGRMAFLALPNVALTYVVAFVGGILVGPWIAAAGAFVGMALTDFLLTGLYPAGFVNAPAMALLGLLGGAFRRTKIDPALAAAIGILSTFLFSVAVDAFTWLLLYASEPAALAPIVLAGLVFNVIPALVNGALFAASVGPTTRAFHAWQRAQTPPRATTPAPASDAPAPAP